jgi:hypothetical protein
LLGSPASKASKPKANWKVGVDANKIEDFFEGLTEKEAKEMKMLINKD